VTSTEYGTITETDLTIANFGVTLACTAGYASGGTPTAACSSAGDYTVADPCTRASPTALQAMGAEAILSVGASACMRKTRIIRIRA
jgi:hypothetical protein